MKPSVDRPRQQRQIVLVVVLFTALAVIVGMQLWPLLEGRSTPPPAPVAARPAPTAPAAASTRRPSSSSSAASSGRPGTRTSRAAKATAGGVLSGVEEVHLAQLTKPEPEPIEGRRNPFTFGPDPKQVAAAAAAEKARASAAATPVVPVAPPVAQGPPPVPPPPPITLKFFGVVTAPGRIGKVAALGDGKFVYHGREGSIVEGRYRIVKIGEESIQLEYVDGRGRQTIRLSGK